MRREERERLEELERRAREPEPEIPLPEPALLSLQRTAGNQSVTRFLQRQPNLTITDRQAVASQRVLDWFVELAGQIGVHLEDARQPLLERSQPPQLGHGGRGAGGTPTRQGRRSGQ